MPKCLRNLTNPHDLRTTHVFDPTGEDMRSFGADRDEAFAGGEGSGTVTLGGNPQATDCHISTAWSQLFL
jgi:hypothetical protein